MAELTNLESELAEVLGPAEAAKHTTETVKAMLDENERSGGHARPHAYGAVDTALQEEHLTVVLKGALDLAGREDPNEVAG